MQEYKADLATLVQESKYFFRLDKDPTFNKIEDPDDDEKWDNLHNVTHALLDDIFEEAFEKPEEWVLECASEIKFGVMEAVYNAELWGNNYDPEKHMWIKYSILMQEEYSDFNFIITDEGDGFDYEHVIACQKIAKSDQLYNYFRENPPKKASGGGLFWLLRDHKVSWNAKGNEIHLTFRVPKKAQYY